MKFTIHQVDVDQPVGFAYGNDELEALEVVKVWQGIAPDAVRVDDPTRVALVPAGRSAALVSGTDIYYAVEENLPTNEPLKTLETDSEEFAELVETAWFELMQGELLITRTNPDDPIDRESRDLIERLASFGIENILMVADGLDQLDSEGMPLPGNAVTPEELARRVAAAVAVVIYGGK